jgi:hypothetical protein
MRKSLRELISSFSEKIFLIVYLIAISYIALSVFLLANLGIWKESLLKDTLFWTIFVAFPLMWKAARIKDLNEFMSKILKPLIAFSVIFEFILGLYTFNLWIEIIILPCMVLLGGMLAYSKLKPEYRDVYKILNWITSIASFWIIGSILWHIIQKYDDYLNKSIFLQFIVPLLLSFLFLPLLYSLALYVHYETIFVVFKRHFKNNKNYWFAFISAIIRFNVNLAGLGRWRHLVFSKNIQSKPEIKSSITLVKQLQKREGNPHTVNSSLGWSPYQAKDFLKDDGLPTSYYNNCYEDDFLAISNPLKLDKNVLFNSISYSISGSELIVKELYLELKVYDSKEDKIALLSMLHVCEVLFYKALEIEPNITLKKSIIKLLKMDFLVKGRRVTLRKIDWTNLTKGYSLEFKITLIE